MKVKWSGIGMVDGRGKINGSVASKNRAGAYVRTKVTPSNPRSIAQQSVRNSFSVISSYWRGLSDANRASWNAAVANWTRTDIFGDIKTPSGFNLFMRLCTPLQNTFNDVVISLYAPTPVALPSFSSLIVNGFVEGGIVTNINIIAPVSNPEGLELLDYAVQVYATPVLSAGKSFVNNEFRMLGFVEFADLATGVLPLYEEKFGLPLINDNIVFQLVVIARGTGQLSTPISAKVSY